MPVKNRPVTRDRLMALAGSVISTGSTWVPVKLSEKQKIFDDLDCLEAFYGGAAGGGKTVCLLATAAKYLDYKNYSAVLFRRTFAELNLEGSLIPKSHEWWSGTPAKWNARDMRWTFPSGATVQFAYLDNETDRFKYQSAEFQFIGFDEIGAHPSDIGYRFLFSRLRRIKSMSDVPLRMRAAGNPGGPGHEWVKARFIDSDDPERAFIPSRNEDNPYLDHAAYVASLNQLDPVERARLLLGDWEIAPSGVFFEKSWFEEATVGEQPPLVRYVRGWDTAFKRTGDYTATVLMGIARPYLYFLSCDRRKIDVADAESYILSKAERDPPGTVIAIESSTAGLPIIQQMRRNRQAMRFSMVPVPHGKRGKLERAAGWMNLLKGGYLKIVRDGFEGMIQDVNMLTGRATLPRNCWDVFEEECLRFTNESTNTDDLIDAASAAYSAIYNQTGGITKIQKKALAWGTPEYYEAVSKANYGRELRAAKARARQAGKSR